MLFYFPNRQSSYFIYSHPSVCFWPSQELLSGCKKGKQGIASLAQWCQFLEIIWTPGFRVLLVSLSGICTQCLSLSYWQKSRKVNRKTFAKQMQKPTMAIPLSSGFYLHLISPLFPLHSTAFPGPDKREVVQSADTARLISSCLRETQKRQERGKRGWCWRMKWNILNHEKAHRRDSFHRLREKNAPTRS